MSISTIILIAVIFFIIVLLFAFTSRQLGDTAVWPFYPRKILSEPEQILYFRLVTALPDHVILSQVQLSRVLGVKKGNNFQAWNNRINRMSLDFVVCKKDFSVLAVIELDDKTHSKPERVKADQKKNKALADADVRMIRWNAQRIPSVQAIQNEVFSSMPTVMIEIDIPSRSETA